MNEIEVKILDIDPAKIRSILKKAGAKKIFKVKIDAQFYDFPDNRIKKAGNHLRLRKVGDVKTEMTFKKLKSNKKYKHNEEVDIEVKDFNEADKFLKLFGLTKVKKYTKTRERYKLKNFQYEIDKYPQIPHFVEVEVKSNNAKQAKALLEKALKVIGYTIKDTKPWNGFEVHKHYKKKI